MIIDARSLMQVHISCPPTIKDFDQSGDLQLQRPRPHQHYLGHLGLQRAHPASWTTHEWRYENSSRGITQPVSHLRCIEGVRWFHLARGIVLNQSFQHRSIYTLDCLDQLVFLQQRNDHLHEIFQVRTLYKRKIGIDFPL